MASLNKTAIPIAVEKHTKLDLSCDHVTTQNFLLAQPVYYRHCLPGEKLDIAALATVRPAPMAVPTYGRMRLNLRAFYVPYSLVMPQWSSFYNDVIGANYDGTSLVNAVPIFTMKTLQEYFLNTIIVTPDGNKALFEIVYTIPPDSSDVDPDMMDLPFDFQIDNVRYKFTELGRIRYKLIRALGYQFIPIGKEDESDLTFNAFGLLAYARIYLDWYANQRYLDSAGILRLRQLLAYNNPSGQLILTSNDLNILLNLVFAVVYDTDGYFVNAWDNPSSPVNSQFTPISWSDKSLYDFDSSNSLVLGGKVASSSAVGNSSTLSMLQSSAGSTYIGSQYLHDALRKLQSYQSRHQLAGASVIDRALAQYGFASKRDKLDRCIYVGSQSIDINVGDIMSTANTAVEGQPSTLGDYAGRGFGQGTKHWEFNTDEMGVFIVVSSIHPSCGMYQGYDRNNRDLSRFDFWQPETDALSVQLIEKGEVYASMDSNFVVGGPISEDISDYTTGFAFTGMYGHKKRPISWQSGDIVLPSVMQGGDSWSLMRQFNDDSFGGSLANVVHSLDFTRATDYANYNRVFQSTDSYNDKFIVNYHFDVVSFAPCKPLFDVFDFDEETKKITLESNGARVN